MVQPYLIAANRRVRRVRSLIRRLMVAAAGLCLVLGALGPSTRADTASVGYIEIVRIIPEGVATRAKFDTGADTSSIHALSIRRLERSGGTWIGFTITGADGGVFQMERKLERTVRIKRHRGDADERPVVRLEICAGDRSVEAEFNLVDRSRFSEPMLVGRNAIAVGVTVDPHRLLTALPSCGS
ncbi:MAG: ATP-dependent zinc protease [Alphaproteobacteria bacterium]|nr:ATP-dependent zinc protease [Alphaproteobacteria bacterium]